MVRPATESATPLVAEIQGLYGAFSFPEKLLQKIWLRGNFDRAAARTTGGRRVRVLHPGKWNLLGGPDFLGARLKFDDGSEITCDVEVHLRAADWDAHGHASDRAYDDVGLHVVLFPPEPRHVTRGARGRELPVLALLPLLHHDLEEFAAEDAVENLANRAAARLPEELGVLPQRELLELLHRHSAARWRQKVHFARLRVQRLGWEAACHQTALEILGYRFNRAPMLRIAGQWPLSEWASGRAEVDAIYADEQAGWSLQGVRPANHPRTRLRQYAAWTRERPDWPLRLEKIGAGSPDVDAREFTREVRRNGKFAALRERMAEEVSSGALSGTRWDNVMCDGGWPLLAAHGSRDFFGIWFHWYAGDLPPLLTSGLRQLGVFDGRAQPACHGAAQGLLGWMIERDAVR